MSTTLSRETETFLETSLKLAGKTEEEARTTGAMDRADEAVEAMFDKRYRTESSPIHRAVWDRVFPAELFVSERQDASAESREAMTRSLDVVRRHVQAGTVHDRDGKVPEGVLEELGDAGYWGLLVPQEYGGLSTPPTAFFPFVTQMAMLDATIGGLASIHGCVGAVDPLRTFGTPEQKHKFLPKLAKGRPLSGFALTEPNAGSDLTALRTRAELDGDHYVLTGEKLFITNANFGRAICVVCLIDGAPAVLLVELPRQENEHFQFRRYGIYAVKNGRNYGLVFNRLRVPKENLVSPPFGNGLMIAYHGLNYGRVALCALAGAGMRRMLAGMLPWARFRRTYGQPIIQRELVEARLGKLAARIVACDAIGEWCAWLLEQGYRGEMECVIAKIFASESQKEAALELCMKTHGGRAFLHGHPLGDNIHEFLAPCIYEGEGEMLGMAFLKSLVKEHGRRYFEPIGRTLAANGIRRPNFANPAHLWALREPMCNYAGWLALEKLHGPSRPYLPNMPPRLREHVEWAIDGVQRCRFEISAVMRKFQLSLADRQCRISEVSSRVRDFATIVVAGLWSARHSSDVVRAAGEMMCEELVLKLKGRRPSDGYYRRVVELGQAVAADQFVAIAGVHADEILMPYSP